MVFYFDLVWFSGLMEISYFDYISLCCKIFQEYATITKDDIDRIIFYK